MLASPTAGILIIGNEILSGRTRDANGPYLLGALRARGIETVELRQVADSEPAIAEAINQLRRRCDRVLCTGGIGPTHDDVTVRALAHAFAKPVVVHRELAERVAAHFGPDAPSAAFRLAEVPEGAEVLLDQVALVPIITLGNVTLLPGVPSFVRASFAHAVGDLRGPPFVVQELVVTASESHLAEALSGIQQAFDDVALGSYPVFLPGRVEVTLRLEGRDAARVAEAMQALKQVLPKSARAPRTNRAKRSAPRPG